MKINFITIFFILLFLGCKEEPSVDYESSELKSEETDTRDDATLMGAWELVGYYNYQDDEVIDSFTTQEGYRQVKMYSPTRVMWSKQVPADSTEWFGYGTYKIEDGQLVEVLDYGSEMMSKIIDEREEFRYELNLSANTFSQIELDEDGNRVYSENYRRIE